MVVLSSLLYIFLISARRSVVEPEGAPLLGDDPSNGLETVGTGRLVTGVAGAGAAGEGMGVVDRIE